MATNNMIPVSNPGGVNQTSPGAMPPVGFPQTPIVHAVGPTASPIIGATGTMAQNNPLIPTANPIAAPGGAVHGVDGSTTQFLNPTQPAIGVAGPAGVAQNSTESGKQLVDIYGKGVGGDLNLLLQNIGGVNSQALQDYAKSLVPEEAKAQAGLMSSLGAAGIGANSSVAALGEANLQAQEFAAIAGESARLTESGQQLEAGILTGMQHDASAEVSQSGWDVFGQVVQGLGQDAGGIMKGAAALAAL